MISDLMPFIVFLSFAWVACPRKYRTEVSALFPLLSKDSSSNGEHDYTSNDPSLDALFVVPTCQHAKTDLVKMGDDVGQEKDYCLEKVWDSHQYQHW